MAWSWSHSDEAYDYALDRLREFPRSLLIEIVAEWRMHERGVSDANWLREWQPTLDAVRARRYPSARMVGIIWARAQQQSTCDNGGWNAWLCPYGCDLHKVPFAEEDDEDYAFLQELRGKFTYQQHT